jgi:poly-gamma-glutamate capsule biosynthesis protein CapA/YwtB (metallophosphatase superfamily)
MPNQSLLRLLDAMDRRTLLGRGAAVMGGLFAGLSLRPGKAYGQARPTAASPGRNNTWNVVVAGEAMVSRPFATHDEPEFLSICEILRESDITYAHCEMNFSEFEELPWTPKAGGGGGSTMIAEPQVAKDLKWMGIDMVSLAHNHAADWGAPGVLSTIQACKQAGIACAGTGRDLEDARSPVFLEQKKGRVALIALNTGPSGAAGLAKGSIPGRPGQNFLRITTKYEVDHSTAEQLKASAKKLGVLRVSSRAPQEFNINPTSDFAYIDGNKFEISTVNDPKDLEGNLRSIRAAREMADFVMVAQHCSASEGERGDVPTKAARAFAMAAIDAGADIYIGHGWHWTLGIEIYKNKPLIYGTGNFFDQNEYIQRVPADAYEGHGYDIDKLTTLTPAEYPLHPAGGGIPQSCN